MQARCSAGSMETAHSHMMTEWESILSTSHHLECWATLDEHGMVEDRLVSNPCPRKMMALVASEHWSRARGVWLAELLIIKALSRYVLSAKGLHLLDARVDRLAGLRPLLARSHHFLEIVPCVRIDMSILKVVVWGAEFACGLHDAFHCSATLHRVWPWVLVIWLMERAIHVWMMPRGTLSQQELCFRHLQTLIDLNSSLGGHTVRWNSPVFNNWWVTSLAQVLWLLLLFRLSLSMLGLGRVFDVNLDWSLKREVLANGLLLILGVDDKCLPRISLVLQAHEVFTLHLAYKASKWHALDSSSILVAAHDHVFIPNNVPSL